MACVCTHGSTVKIPAAMQEAALCLSMKLTAGAELLPLALEPAVAMLSCNEINLARWLAALEATPRIRRTTARDSPNVM